MSVVRETYKVFRSILFSAIIAVGVLYLALYVVISVPGVQNSLRARAEKELSSLLASKIEIGSLQFKPFNELTIHDVKLYTPDGELCVSAETIGAGLHLWHLLRERRIEITYAEILGLDGRIWQSEEGGSLNIKFLIDAFAPKEKNRPPAKFDLCLRNVVIRQSALSFDRRWKPETPGRFNPDHIRISDLKADLILPQIKNEDFAIDLRRLAFKEQSGITVGKLGLKAHVTPRSLSVENLKINIGESRLATSDFAISFSGFDRIKEALSDGNHFIKIIGENISPRDFRAFLPILNNFGQRLALSVSAEGNLADLRHAELTVNDNDGQFSLNAEAALTGLLNPSEISVHDGEISLHADAESVASVLSAIPGIKEPARRIAARAGDIAVELEGNYDALPGGVEAEGYVSTRCGDLSFSADGAVTEKHLSCDFEASTGSLDLGTLLDKKQLGFISLDAEGSIEGSPREFDGRLKAEIPFVDFNGRRFSNIRLQGGKKKEELFADCDIDDPSAILGANASIHLDGPVSTCVAQVDIRRIIPSDFGILDKYRGYVASGYADINLTGNNIDNVCGDIHLNSLSFSHNDDRSLSVSDIVLNASADEREGRTITLKSDFVDAEMNGRFSVRTLAAGFMETVSSAVPILLPGSRKYAADNSAGSFNITVKPNDAMADFFALPARPLENITVDGGFDFAAREASCRLDAPYILQGSKKLIAGTTLNLHVDNEQGADIEVTATVPVKNDRMNLRLTLDAFANDVNSNLGWTMAKDKTGVGNVAFRARLVPQLAKRTPGMELTILPSVFSIGKADWNIAPSHFSYRDDRIKVDGIRIWHGDQFVKIQGTASASPEDILFVNLANIDLKYIFDTLNINYVTFGGIATGDLQASSLFSREPVAFTDDLRVRRFSYNDAELGFAHIRSLWNNQEKEVEIHADIRDEHGKGALVDGGVFVTRDSLSFEMKADKVNVAFLKPFMSAFTSDVGGRASGDVKLFGTFSDIDLTGRAYADSIYMKVDQTNVYYHGSDSVILDPGNIRIPGFRLYDRNGRTAILEGYVKHRYFHDPVFGFTVKNASNLLCFDTNPKINPDWYGRIYASGNGRLTGRPGFVSIMMDMTTSPNSNFTFVLSETQTALDYSFLTFSDKKKEALESVTVEETLEDKYYRKHEEQQQGPPSVFAMDLRANITPDAQLTLVMDPRAGDCITARGSGALQLGYDTESDEISMFGKYSLAEGKYKFSLQELILRDFTIKPGSSIAFNGDPYQATLDITAAYRVNTNLSDLDKSFSTDKDLNRTNVPVDALLNVTGDLEHPEIAFDIALPTLTSDVERKVKSIISTDDMMSRQIIYLLALQRFYTPEYMGVGSNGGAELASVASSTISSQLSNMIGQLTDKFTLSPSFRSDKGDFSDMEVDVSLSSRLLNNRLLINGNFGYRDRSTSQTTFIGDFDIEYLLNKNGNLRLKAYNHFNDQYYYLKSALTTQGIGVIYRRDFDNPFTFLKRKRKKIKPAEENRSKSDTEVKIKGITKNT